MKMSTRCPACGTAFRIYPHHLAARDGQVRCGRCTSIFDARSALATGAAAAGEARAASARSVSTIRALSHETAPDGYETSVDAYFRALAEPDAE